MTLASVSRPDGIYRERMYSVPLADWLMAVGTLGAFVIGLGLLIVTVADRQKAQARLIFAWPSRNTTHPFSRRAVHRS